ncbi:MASE3 domain-containing protein [Halanaerobaculum tunisiense]
MKKIINKLLINVLWLILLAGVGIVIPTILNLDIYDWINKCPYFIKIDKFYLVEFILEVGVTFICWNIFLLLLHTYQASKNSKQIFLAVNFLFAGIINLSHTVLVFRNSYLQYSSSSHLFALSTRFIVVLAILISWLITKEKLSKYYFSLVSLFSGIYFISIIMLVLNLQANYSGVIRIVKLLLIISIIYGLKKFIKQRIKSDLLLINTCIFLIIGEIILLFKVDIFSSAYFVAHVYKVTAFIYLFRKIFNEEVTNGILAQQEIELKNVKLNHQQEMIQELKSQRHDFKNELQTIYTMLQLDKTKKVKNYVKDIQVDLDETRTTLKNEGGE